MGVFLIAQPHRVMGERQEKDPRMLSGMCSMCFEEEPHDINSADQLSSPWLHRID